LSILAGLVRRVNQYPSLASDRNQRAFSARRPPSDAPVGSPPSDKRRLRRRHRPPHCKHVWPDRV